MILLSCLKSPGKPCRSLLILVQCLTLVCFYPPHHPQPHRRHKSSMFKAELFSQDVFSPCSISQPMALWSASLLSPETRVAASPYAMRLVSSLFPTLTSSPNFRSPSSGLCDSLFILLQKFASWFPFSSLSPTSPAHSLSCPHSPFH